MTSEYIFLDPTFPFCWESTETLRIGFDRAEVRVHSPSPPVQRLLDKLRSGIRSRDLNTYARRIGLSKEEQDQLLHQLSPALVHSMKKTPEGPQAEVKHATFAVYGSGAYASTVRVRFEQAGFKLVTDESVPDFAVLVEYFLGTTAKAQSLLIDDVCHLPIRLTDRHISIGPLVLPGGRPCLACVELHGIGDDPSQQVLAAQLANEVPSTATSHSIDLVSAAAIAIARLWQHEHKAFAAVRLRYPVHQGLPVPIPDIQHIMPHPGCGCVSLAHFG